MTILEKTKREVLEPLLKEDRSEDEKERHKKCIWARKEKEKKAIRLYIWVEDILDYLTKILVGRFYRKFVKLWILKPCIKEFWLPQMVYKIIFHVTLRGWLCFFLKSIKYVNILLQQNLS